MAIELFTWRAAPSTGGVCVFYAELLSGAGYDYYQETLRKDAVFVISFMIMSCQLSRSMRHKNSVIARKDVSSVGEQVGRKARNMFF